MKTIGVEFKKGGKQYIFFDNDLELSIGDHVVVETERGLQFGTVCAKYDKSDDKEHSKVHKVANKDDIKQYNMNVKEASKSIIKAQEIADNLKLDMKFLDAYYTFDRKQLVFQFLADNRVDFRELAKSLASIYKTRIELRQVGVRDKAKEISGIGTCGRKLCCSLFLNDLDSVAIAQVKNQNLALNPMKINGLCGRLLCCLKYEDDLYTVFRKNLPEIGDTVKINNKEAKVISLDIPRQKYIAIIDEDSTKVEVDVTEKNEKSRQRSNK